MSEQTPEHHNYTDQGKRNLCDVCDKWKGAPEHATNGNPTQTADANDPDAPPPSGITADVFDLAALVNTVKTTFEFDESTSVKIIDLALSFRITKEQMANAMGPPPSAKLTLVREDPDEPPAE